MWETPNVSSLGAWPGVAAVCGTVSSPHSVCGFTHTNTRQQTSLGRYMSRSELNHSSIQILHFTDVTVGGIIGKKITYYIW